MIPNKSDPGAATDTLCLSFDISLKIMRNHCFCKSSIIFELFHDNIYEKIPQRFFGVFLIYWCGGKVRKLLSRVYDTGLEIWANS